jgi:hypothetical protein
MSGIMAASKILHILNNKTAAGLLQWSIIHGFPSGSFMISLN